MMINELRDYIENLERELQSTDIRHSADELDKLLSDEFIEYGSSGRIFTKQSIISILSVEGDTKYEMWGFRLVKLSDTVLQVTYNTKTIENGVDKSYALRSSIWRNENGDWRMLFHQGTPMHKEEVERNNL